MYSSHDFTLELIPCPLDAKANKDADGRAFGVSVDMARELGKRLGVPVELVVFSAAGKVVEAVKAAQVDIAFVAIDPVRGADIGQTPPYVVIEGAYMVAIDSPIKTNAEVDQIGNRVVVGLGSAYDLFLTRELKAATIVRSPSSPTVLDMMAAPMYLSGFVADLKASGFVAQALAWHKIEGATVADL
jgi:polar amino acid transport system substrate-binding protein